jgi:4-hydroxy-tetrahydrodipicolinate synthase
VPAGSTGEAYALSDAERLKVIETVIGATAGKLPIVAGTASAGTERTIELSKAAENAGADGVQVGLETCSKPLLARIAWVAEMK